MFKKNTATLRGNSNLKGHRRMDIQLFAGKNPEEPDVLTEPKEPEEEKTYTQEELDKLLQSEADRRVSEALKTAQEKWERELEEKLKKERVEAEELVKLSVEEREKALLEKQQKEIEKRERALQMRELELKTIDILQEKKLPLQFKEFILGKDENETNQKIDKFQNLWQEAIQREIDERLKGKSPQQIDDKKDIVNPWAKETFNLTEQGRIYKEDPELAEKLKAAAGR